MRTTEHSKLALVMVVAILGGLVLAAGVAQAGPGDITRVSVSSAGNEGNNISGSPSISADGRYVAFTSVASNLVAGDTNDRADVLVRDRQNGTTELVSVDSAGNQGNGPSFASSLSADGRHVAFHSEASNLVADDTNGTTDAFVHELGPVGCDVVGTGGNDDLAGTSGDDLICGLAGDDTIAGAGGDDILIGNKGDDTLSGQRGNDTLWGSSGADTLTGGNGGDSHLGKSGDDVLEASDGVSSNDVVSGGSGTDECRFDGGDMVSKCP